MMHGREGSSEVSDEDSRSHKVGLPTPAQRYREGVIQGRHLSIIYTGFLASRIIEV